MAALIPALIKLLISRRGGGGGGGGGGRTQKTPWDYGNNAAAKEMTGLFGEFTDANNRTAESTVKALSSAAEASQKRTAAYRDKK
jgi:hypothetical protein